MCRHTTIRGVVTYLCHLHLFIQTRKYASKMRSCVCAYMYMCICVYVHTCNLLTFIHSYMRTCVHAYIRTCVHANMHADKNTKKRHTITFYGMTCLCHFHQYIHTYMHTYICTNTYTDIHICKYAIISGVVTSFRHFHLHTYGKLYIYYRVVLNYTHP